MTRPWSPTSWQDKPIAQGVVYPDEDALDEVLRRLAVLPPLTTSWEIQRLKSHLAEAAAGRQFLLQGGDCSERFADCRGDVVANKLKILLNMSLILAFGSRKQVIRVGRIAGQYAKPRSNQEETRDGLRLPSYRGDLINAPPFTEADRTPDPKRMLRGYERAALTLNFIRSLAQGGFADFRHPELWELSYMRDNEQSPDFERIVEAVGDAIDFMQSISGRSMTELRSVEVFASHEGLLLEYEQAATRRVPRRQGWWNLATHLPWIGDRTRQIGGAHVEYFRGIENPVGLKVGPTMEPEELVALCQILNPQAEPGRLVLIHRFGAHAIAEKLPPLIQAVRATGCPVVWTSDPMHGNTRTTGEGIKTRSFDDVLGELNTAQDIHTAHGTVLAGVHFELTGENVTECTGGARGLSEMDLHRKYESDVDPRLNYEQALEMALSIARRIRAARNGEG